MTLKTDIDADATTIFLDATDGFAVSITHKPGGSGGTAIDAITGDERITREFGDNGDTVEVTREIIIDGSVTLTYEDRFTIDSVNYGISEIPVPVHGLRSIQISRKRKRKTGLPSGNSIEI